MGTRAEWAKSLANKLGNASPNREIINWISAWTAAENTKAVFNPLATTYSGIQNAWEFNSAGVKNYPSRDDGLNATVATLNMSYDGYSDIVAGIRGNNPQLAQSGLNSSPWGTNPAYVQLLYLSGYKGDETLLSEENRTDNSGTRSGGEWSDTYVMVNTPGGSVPMTAAQAREYEQTGGVPSMIDSALSGAVTEQQVYNGIKGIAGAFLIIGAIIIGFKTFVPSTTLAIGLK